MKRAPFELVICPPRTHCGTCRSREGGRNWRTNAARAFELPGGVIDFACPHGLAFHDGPPAGPVGRVRHGADAISQAEVDGARQTASAGGCCGPPGQPGG